MCLGFTFALYLTVEWIVCIVGFKSEIQFNRHNLPAFSKWKALGEITHQLFYIELFYTFIFSVRIQRL